MAILTLCALANPAAACETALLLAIDVSGSIDGGDYRLQTEGLAAALSDPDIVYALTQDQVALAVIQWSGTSEQALVLPWQRMLDEGDVARFAARAGDAPRAFTGSDTAVGEGLRFALAQFAAVPDCHRRVIDVSGDGQENAGFSDAKARSEAADAGAIINAIAIEEPGQAFPITSYYAKWIITPGGFVMSARGLQDYAETLRLKILRELLTPVG
ncbi:vWFA domain containing protein [Paracoccaceae bacterium]|jgi:Ca-activated chloride channel family protein